MTARITAAPSLLRGILPQPEPRFAPFWFRNELVGAVSPEWLNRLDPNLFHIEARGGALLPHVALRGVDRRRDSDLVPIEAINLALRHWADQLHALGLLPGHRAEPVLIFGTSESHPLFEVERALLRPLGLLLRTVQINVHVLDERELRIWVAQRAATKPVDPGRLDCLVGGGIRGADTPLATLVRECQEEAGISRAQARRANPVGVIDSIGPSVDGEATVLHRERAMLYDLKVGPDFSPQFVDGEIEAALLTPAAEVIEQITAGRWTDEGAWATLDLIRRLAPAGD